MNLKKRIPVPLSAACILLCLVLVSAHFSTGMIARYVTRASGSDSGRLAAFRVTATAEETEAVVVRPLDAEKGGTADYVIEITNPGDTAVRYEALVSFADDEERMPELSFRIGSEEEPAELKDGKLIGNLAPGASETVTVCFDLSEALAPYAESGLDFSNDTMEEETVTVPFEVTVNFAQID